MNVFNLNKIKNKSLIMKNNNKKLKNEILKLH